MLREWFGGNEQLESNRVGKNHYDPGQESYPVLINTILLWLRGGDGVNNW